MEFIYDLLDWMIVGVGDKVRHQHNHQNSYKWDYSYDGRYKPDQDD